MSKTTLLLVLGALAVVLGLSSFFVISERELALVTQFGDPKRTITSPGLYWKLPLVQEVRRMESRILGSHAPPA